MELNDILSKALLHCDYAVSDRFFEDLEVHLNDISGERVVEIYEIRSLWLQNWELLPSEKVFFFRDNFMEKLSKLVMGKKDFLVIYSCKLLNEGTVTRRFLSVVSLFRELYRVNKAHYTGLRECLLDMEAHIASFKA